MRSIYVISIWTGGGRARQWKAYDEPKVLANGMGVEFTNIDTRLRVIVIGNISVEQFESGKEEIEAIPPRPRDPEGTVPFRPKPWERDDRDEE